MKNIFNKRFSLLYSFISTYVLISFGIRISLYALSFDDIDFSLISIIKIFSLGFFFDLSVALFFSTIYYSYLLALPSKLVGSILDKVITYFLMGILLFISIFSFVAEFPFWEEFNTRFNFIAVDYLIYTYEVFENINQSTSVHLK